MFKLKFCFRSLLCTFKFLIYTRNAPLQKVPLMLHLLTKQPKYCSKNSFWSSEALSRFTLADIEANVKKYFHYCCVWGRLIKMHLLLFNSNKFVGKCIACKVGKLQYFVNACYCLSIYASMHVSIYGYRHTMCMHFIIDLLLES